VSYSSSAANDYSGNIHGGKLTVKGTSSSSNSQQPNEPHTVPQQSNGYRDTDAKQGIADTGSNAPATVSSVGNTFDVYNGNASKDAPCLYQGKPGKVARVPLPIDDSGNYKQYGVVQSGNGGITCVPTDPADQNTPENEPTADNAQVRTQKIEHQVREQLAELTTTKPALHFDGHEPHVNAGINTNFYVTGVKTAARDTTILDEEVTIEAVPVAYTYEYGTGDPVYTTRDSGTAQGSVWDKSKRNFKPTDTSYAFKESGNYHAYVTVTYQGRYRLKGGDWNIVGSLTVRSDPTLVRVWDTEVHSVGKTCHEDPGARGCPAHPDEPDRNNPNPKLTQPDPVTGQHWHRDDSGAGDTEWRLHKKK
jgi:hypothetical protein